MKKHLTLFTIFALTYMNIEVLIGAFFVPQGKYFAFLGRTSLWMGLLGGIAGMFIGLLNEKTKLSIFKQTIISALFITTIEFLTGLLLNIHLGFAIWDYSSLPLNIMGQICILFIVFWFIITPFAIWLDDMLRFLIFSEEKPNKLINNYKNLFKF